MVNFQYNYQKIFFRRPLWSADNRRLWSILAATGTLTVLLTLFSTHWAKNIPSRILADQISKEYKSYLAQVISAPGEGPAVPADTAGQLSADKQAEIKPQLAAEAEPLSKTIRKINPSRSAYHDQLEEREETDGYRYLLRPEAGSVAAVTSAIEGVAGYAGLGKPGQRSRREKPLSLSNEEEILQRYEKQINIPLPERMHFASQNGNRDLHETTAVMELNETDIRYCFEKYSRFDPTFKGDISISFTIHPQGYVIPSSIKIVRSNIDDPRVLRCIKKSIERWRNFPQIALEDGMFTVTRKYIF